jgi:hypothetical protein
MAPFGGQSPNFPRYIGGGNLWEEPIREPLKWWQWLIQAVTFDLVCWW